MRSPLTTTPQRTLVDWRRLLSGVGGVLPLLFFSAAGHAQSSGTTSDGFVWSSVSGAATVTGYTGPGGAVTIPSTINSLPVTGIGSNAFRTITTVTSVTIPNGVTSIGNNAFNACSNLVSVTIPISVTSIGSEAFLYCSSLSSVAIPSSVTSIGSTMFYRCTSLTSVTIPNSVTSIGNYAFYGCSSLGSVTIPNSVTNIGIDVFNSCTRLTGAFFMGNAPSMGSGVFSNTASGFKVYYFTGAAGFTKPTWNGYATAIFPFTYKTGNNQITITRYTGSGGVVAIPDTINGLPVTGIGSYAFQNSTLTSVAIPASVSSLEAGAFSECFSLASVTIPKSITSIGNSAFSNCRSLTSVTIPSSVASIGSGPFSNCTSLTSITVDALNSFYSSMNGVLFDNAQTTLIQYPGGKAGSYTIPSSVTSIASSAFQSCKSLTNVTIPNSITSIGDSAFFSCTGLKTAVFMGKAPLMGSGVFSNTASGFTVYYFNSAAGFTTPTWNDGYNTYPTINMGADSPVAPWLLSEGFAYNADLQSDSNSDGVNLLAAYALNLDPNRNLTGSLPEPVLGSNQISITFYAGSAGVTYSVEASTDLKIWSTAGVTIFAPDANHFSTATVPMTGTLRFMRLKVVY